MRSFICVLCIMFSIYTFIMVVRVRLDFSYDGCAFHGFASQRDLRTVQGELEKAISLFLGKNVGLTVAGRTDAGVHAMRQVVHFDIDPMLLFKNINLSFDEIFSFDVFKNVSIKKFFDFNSKNTNDFVCSKDILLEDLRKFFSSLCNFRNLQNKNSHDFSYFVPNDCLNSIYRDVLKSYFDSWYVNSDVSDDVLNVWRSYFLGNLFDDEVFLCGVFDYLNLLFNVALFYFKKRLNKILAMRDDSRVLQGLENKPKSDVLVFNAQIVPLDFDARFSALERMYVYRICDCTVPYDVFRRNMVFWFDGFLSVDRMRQACKLMTGEHNFLSFCKPRVGASTIRTLKRLEVDVNSFGEIEVLVVADAFCHSMVRSIVGVLIAIASGRKDVTWGRFLLDNPSRSHGVSIAPAHGLMLIDVKYPSFDLLGVQARKAKVFRTLSAKDLDCSQSFIDEVNNECCD